MKKLFSLLIVSFLLFISNVSTAGIQDSKQLDEVVPNDSIQNIVDADSDLQLTETQKNAEREKKALNNIIPTKKTSGVSLMSVMRGALGMVVLLLIAYIFSANRKKIAWRVVVLGLSFQIVLAVLILYVPFVQVIFEFVGKVFILILDFTYEGTKFLFKAFATGEIEMPLVNFAIKILPTIIFFSALTSMLFYFGIIQKVVWLLAWFMSKLLKLSGAESLSVAGNIFLGQTESPIMIKEYLAKMNKSEILLVMTGGMATLAGGVLAAYIGFLGGDDPVQRLLFAKHLLAASVMAAPGPIVISKILVPQTEDIDKTIEISKKLLEVMCLMQYRMVRSRELNLLLMLQECYWFLLH